MDKNSDEKHLKILKKFKNLKTGVFIDEANIFYIEKEIGWKLDWLKIKNLLEKYLRTKNLNYYLGMPKDGRARIKNEKVKLNLETLGFNVITKPLKKIYVDQRGGKFKYKCNFDVEIAFDIARLIEKLDLVVVVSGDSDYLEAKKFSLERGKKFMFLCFEKRVAWEIRKVYHLFFEDIKELVQKQTPRQARGGITAKFIA